MVARRVGRDLNNKLFALLPGPFYFSRRFLSEAPPVANNCTLMTDRTGTGSYSASLATAPLTCRSGGNGSDVSQNKLAEEGSVRRRPGWVPSLQRTPSCHPRKSPPIASGGGPVPCYLLSVVCCPTPTTYYPTTYYPTTSYPTTSYPTTNCTKNPNLHLLSTKLEIPTPYLS